MTDLTSFLKQLISLPGLSGHEHPARQIIEEAWKPLSHEVHTSKLGSLHALRRGRAPQPRPSLLIAAHMDAIGLMVKGRVEEWLQVTAIGGVDGRVLPGQLVIIHGRKALPGVVAQPPGHLLPPKAKDSPVAIEHLWVDTGLPAKQLSQWVRVGDLISFAQPPLDTAAETLCGHTLDNRASVAALTHCLKILQTRTHAWDIWAVASSQEEVGGWGAATSAFQLCPTLAVAIDVTFGAGPGSPSHLTYPIGKGPTLGWGPDIHPRLYQAFENIAKRHEIPYSMEPLPRHSGTDAYTLQVTQEGIPCMVISIPLRYMHTPVEMVSLKDITRAGRLLAEFAASLEVDFMDKLTWDDES
jgi:endoglucanase